MGFPSWAIILSLQPSYVHTYIYCMLGFQQSQNVFGPKLSVGLKSFCVETSADVKLLSQGSETAAHVQWTTLSGAT